MVQFLGDLVFLATDTYCIIINMNSGQLHSKLKNLEGNERILHMFLIEKKEKCYIVKANNSIYELNSF